MKAERKRGKERERGGIKTERVGEIKRMREKKSG